MSNHKEVFMRIDLMSRRNCILVLLLIICSIVVLPAQATVLNQAGNEFRINTETIGDQGNPGVAVDANGNFVVIWESAGQDGSGEGVYGQRYDNTGTAVGNAFQVNTETTNDQDDPVVAMDANGNFVVIWESREQDGSGEGIYGQRYAADGTTLGSEFLVNTTTAAFQADPAVAMDANGNFVVVWESSGHDGNGKGIAAQRYAADGTAQGGELLANTAVIGDQEDPEVAMDADGNFVIIWESFGQDGDGYGLYGQRYDANGTAQGAEFLVNTETTGDQTFQHVAMNATGDFVVVWKSDGQDGDGYGVYGQRYSSTGATVGNEFQVNVEVTGNQEDPAVTLDEAGNFFVVWESDGQDGDRYGIYGRHYDSTGTPVAGEFRINTTTVNDQEDPRTVLDTDGNLIVVWEDYAQDGDGGGIYGSRFAFDAPTLNINFTTGQPGSFFTLRGFNFPSLTEMEMLANGRILDNSISTDASGNAVVVLNTSGAARGTYTIVVRTRTMLAQDTEQQVNLVLSEDAPLRARETIEGAIEVNLSQDTSPVNQQLYIPLVRR
jgi:hypothetical protein